MSNLEDYADKLFKENGELKRKVASMEKVVEAATWALHLAHGVGKAGGTPMPGEFESMAETLGTSLRALEEKKP